MRHVMTERLLQYIWRYQYFDMNGLMTEEGEPVFVLFPGMLNTDQGPDFLQARIRIGETVWIGSVELHLLTSGWNAHGHEKDPNYANVILHVVWDSDCVPNSIPILSLNGRVPGVLLQRYQALMANRSRLPCHKGIREINTMVRMKWLERMLVERLTRKGNEIRKLLELTHFHWEEVAWWMLARNFGGKVNAESFEVIARSIPFRVLSRCRQHLDMMEALLFGQAGLLPAGISDGYGEKLKTEYNYLSHVYGCNPAAVPLHFLRMRPVNFPTVRLAQLAMLLHHQRSLADLILQTDDIKVVKAALSVTASEYWSTHYRFLESSVYREKGTGQSFVGALLINAVIPLLFAYGEYNSDENRRNRAIEWLMSLVAENNSITRRFMEAGWHPANAGESQGLLELYRYYCCGRRCLECAVGNALLKG